MATQNNGIQNFIVTVVASLLLILVGIIYFMLTMWIIKVGASWAGFTDLTGDTVLLTAGIITAASMIGSALQK